MLPSKRIGQDFNLLAVLDTVLVDCASTTTVHSIRRGCRHAADPRNFNAVSMQAVAASQHSAVAAQRIGDTVVSLSTEHEALFDRSTWTILATLSSCRFYCFRSYSTNPLTNANCLSILTGVVALLISISLNCTAPAVAPMVTPTDAAPSRSL